MEIPLHCSSSISILSLQHTFSPLEGINQHERLGLSDKKLITRLANNIKDFLRITCQITKLLLLKLLTTNRWIFTTGGGRASFLTAVLGQIWWNRIRGLIETFVYQRSCLKFLSNDSRARALSRHATTIQDRFSRVPLVLLFSRLIYDREK